MLGAAAPLSTSSSPPSQLPTPMPTNNLMPNKLYSCIALHGAVRLQPQRLNISRAILRWCSTGCRAPSQSRSCARSQGASATATSATIASGTMSPAVKNSLGAASNPAVPARAATGEVDAEREVVHDDHLGGSSQLRDAMPAAQRATAQGPADDVRPAGFV